MATAQLGASGSFVKVSVGCEHFGAGEVMLKVRSADERKGFPVYVEIETEEALGLIASIAAALKGSKENR